MVKKVLKPMAAILIFSILASTPAAYAASIPSKTGSDQTLALRASELARARVHFSLDGISSALSAEGLTPEQIQSRLTALSTADLMALAQNPAQIRSAGARMGKKFWTIAGIAAGVVVIGALTLNEDDEGGSDDGED